MTDHENEKAIALIDDITRALANGTKHFNKAGEELTTVEAVLRTLITEGGVALQAAVVDCFCRNPVCGHRASVHTGPLGMCLSPGCTCGPGGWA